MDTCGDTNDIWGHAALEQNRSWLMAYAVSMTGDPTAAEDIVQRVFGAAWESREKYDGSYDFGAWLRGIAKNMIRRHWAREQKEQVFVGIDEIEALDAVVAAHRRDHIEEQDRRHRIRQLRECVRGLAENTRQLLRWKYQKRMRSDEIARLQNRKANTVDKAISRARKALYRCLQAKMADV